VVTVGCHQVVNKANTHAPMSCNLAARMKMSHFSLIVVLLIQVTRSINSLSKFFLLHCRYMLTDI